MKKLLETASEVFGEKGYDKTSLEDIAERMDLRGPSLYYYVQTKEDLFIRCANNILSSNFANLEKARESKGTPIKRLEHMLKVQILEQIGGHYPNHIPFFISVTSTEPSLMAYISDIRKKHIKYFWELAEEAEAAGELKSGQWQLGLRLAAGALGSLHQWYRRDGELAPEEMATLIAKSLMKLIRK